MNTVTTAANPLLADTLPPAFDRIRPEHVAPAIGPLLERVKADFAALEAAIVPSWSGLMEPLERIDDDLSRAWGAVRHLLGVRNNDELRKAHAEWQPKIVTLYTAMSQSRAVFDGLKALRDGPEFGTLDDSQRRTVELAVRDAELAGVGLDGPKKERFGAIQMRLAELSTTFSNNVLDATKAWSMTLTEPAEVAGLPESTLGMAAQNAREAGDEGATASEGPWRITLDIPCVQPFLMHSKRADLRERLYRAYVTRASDGDADNAPLIDEILTLRHEKAVLLGFSDFASLSLARKMAGSVDAASALLEELLQASRTAGEREHAELEAFARDHAELGDGAYPTPLRHWDVGFWSERLRQDRYDIDEEALRAYFPLPRVLDGLFSLANRLFGVTVVAADGEAPIWHADVRFFTVKDEAGAPIAAFYLDPYSRPAEKRGGAWMDECVGRSATFGELRLPVAHLVCNGTPPLGEQPSLMRFREVETLFHEFGHGLQHMLTRVDHGHASGIRNVDWDAVELPSQFMENWCYERPTFDAISGHWQSGEGLDEATFNRLRDARTFRAASAMLRQLNFSLTDLQLHLAPDGSGRGTPFEVQAAIQARTSVLPQLPEDRFLCSFQHIFAGGYAAGYYSYKWAEVLSADAFSAFEDAGLNDDAAVRRVGRRFRDTVLALGGGQHPMAVFSAFRGREPTTDALLRHHGLTRQAA